jgi:hypothetical protein
MHATGTYTTIVTVLAAEMPSIIHQPPSINVIPVSIIVCVPSTSVKETNRKAIAHSASHYLLPQTSFVETSNENAVNSYYERF